MPWWDAAERPARLHAVKDPAMCARRLATEALTRGAGDNITVVVAFLRPLATLEEVFGGGRQVRPTSAGLLARTCLLLAESGMHRSYWALSFCYLHYKYARCMRYARLGENSIQPPCMRATFIACSCWQAWDYKRGARQYRPCVCGAAHHADTRVPL